MNREADKAYKAEKIIGELTNTKVSRSFKINKKSFADVSPTMRWNVHEDKQAVDTALSKMRFGRTTKMRGGVGAGATAGADVGSNVSLNRQASGSQQTTVWGVNVKNMCQKYWWHNKTLASKTCIV